MSKIFDAKPNAWCFNNCPHASLYVDTTTLYTNAEPYLTTPPALACQNEKLCERWYKFVQEERKIK